MYGMIKEKMDHWKSGKFVPFSTWTFSVNVHVLSKLWYRTSLIDIRLGDLNKMSSAIKSWIYQDRLIKPQEELLFRNVKDGGLGLFHLESKVHANLICSFLLDILILLPMNSTSLFSITMFLVLVLGNL